MRAVAAMVLGASLVGGAGIAGAGESVEYLYRLHCSGCHGVEGAGSQVGRIPPFVGIVGHFAATEEGRLYLVRVPGVANAALSDDDTARLLNYVLHTWGAAELPADMRDFTASEVSKSRETHVDDISQLRAKLGAELARHGKSIAY
jgi:mono/diheme cytochrome c family protein